VIKSFNLHRKVEEKLRKRKVREVEEKLGIQGKMKML
jgi:hypothetical protein